MLLLLEAMNFYIYSKSHWKQHTFVGYYICSFILYHVIPRLIQHCFLSKMGYLNVKYVIATRSYEFFIYTQNLIGNMGPSIYDVHTEGGGGQAQVDACRRGVKSHVDVQSSTQKIKIESTYVILSSSHAKKLVSFLPGFRLLTE